MLIAGPAVAPTLSQQLSGWRSEAPRLSHLRPRRHNRSEGSRPYVRRVLVARPRGKQGSGVALDRPEPSPKLSEGGP